MDPSQGVTEMNKLAALAAAFGIDPTSRDWSPFISISPQMREAAAARWRSLGDGTGRRVLVNVSAGPVTRRWQTDKYIAVIQHLRRRLPDALIFVTGAPNEEDRIADVVARSGATRAPTRSLMEVFALVATADLVFTPDTSVAHAASALRRPVVAMYRQREPRRWAVNPDTGEVVEHTGDLLADLSVAPAVAAIDRALARL
jgi:ADP-heptose:LPS heptosyltransferase